METCTAGAGSLLLEFGTLSRLTGDAVFENVARKAFYAVWNRRSELNLLGNTISAFDGRWLHAVSSTGAGIDSFFECVFTLRVAESELIHSGRQICCESLCHVRRGRVVESVGGSLLGNHFADPSAGRLLGQSATRSRGGLANEATATQYRGANMHSGQLSSVVVDSLSAFFPGVQTLVGDVESAIKAHAVYAFQWKVSSRFRKLARQDGSDDFGTDKGRRQAKPTPERAADPHYLSSATEDFLSSSTSIDVRLSRSVRISSFVAPKRILLTLLQGTLFDQSSSSPISTSTRRQRTSGTSKSRSRSFPTSTIALGSPADWPPCSI